MKNLKKYIEKVVSSFSRESIFKKIYAHADADGICSAFIVNQLTGAEVVFLEELRDVPEEKNAILFLDLGAQKIDVFNEKTYMIDHHIVKNKNSYNDSRVFLEDSGKYSTSSMLALIAEDRILQAIGVIGHVGDCKNLSDIEEGLLNKLIESNIITKRLEPVEIDNTKSMLESIYYKHRPQLSLNKFLEEISDVLEISEKIIKYLNVVDYTLEDITKISFYLAYQFGIKLEVKERYRIRYFDNLSFENLSVLLNSASKLGFCEIAMQYLDKKKSLKELQGLRESAKQYYKKALRNVEEINSKNNSIRIFKIEGVKKRMVGAVANLIKDKENISNIICFLEEGEYIKGSFRLSVDSFSKITDLLDDIPEIRIGGHEKAIGFTIRIKEKNNLLNKLENLIL